MRLGIDLGGTKIEGIILDPSGTEVVRERIATPAGDYAATLAAVGELIRSVEEKAGTRVPRIGIGIPGVVSPATGLVKNANSTWLIGKPLDRDLETLLGRPVRLENDANCFAVSEATDGAGAGGAVVFGVILGTGVGGGIVVDGHPLRGRNAIGGEWGHNPLPWPTADEIRGRRCYCGLTGCIETFLSGPGMAADFQRDTGRDATSQEVCALAETGDNTAVAALERYENRLARALAHIINIIDPDVIVLGGGMSNIRRLYANVPRLWDRWIFSDRVDTRLEPNHHGDSSGVRGASWLWPDSD